MSPSRSEPKNRSWRTAIRDRGSGQAAPGEDASRSSAGAATRGLVAAVHRPLEALARRLFDLEVTGREHLPEGAFVIAANHFSFIDPVMLTLAAQRNVRYMAVAGLFDTHHLFDRLITFFGAIPTPRDVVPVGAIRTALADLDAGEILGIFPEGRRVTEWRETNPTRGAAWLALAAGVPMVPVAIEGTQDTLSVVRPAFRRTSIRMWIDEPLHPDDYIDRVDPIDAMTRDWMEVVGQRLDAWWADSRLQNTPT